MIDHDLTDLMEGDAGRVLRDAAAREALPVSPAGVIMRRAERRRARRRAAGAALTVLVVAAVGAGSLLLDGTDPARGVDLAPAPPVAESVPPPSVPETATPAPAPAPSTTAAPSTGPTQDAAARAWPAPPTAHVARPYDRDGVDFGRILDARTVDGRAVITVDRQQYYTAREWEARTGEASESDGRIVNDSTRTRDFTVEADALLHLDWSYHEDDSAPRERVDPATFVRRTRELLAEEPEGVTVWMFHTGGVDGPVAYVDDAAPEIG